MKNGSSFAPRASLANAPPPRRRRPPRFRRRGAACSSPACRPPPPPPPPRPSPPGPRTHRGTLPQSCRRTYKTCLRHVIHAPQHSPVLLRTAGRALCSEVVRPVPEDAAEQPKHLRREGEALVVVDELRGGEGGARGDGRQRQQLARPCEVGRLVGGHVEMRSVGMESGARRCAGLQEGSRKVRLPARVGAAEGDRDAGALACGGGGQAVHVSPTGHGRVTHSRDILPISRRAAALTVVVAALRPPVHRPVREDEPSARGQRAGADRLHGVVAAEEELQRVLGLDVSEKCLGSVYGGGAAACSAPTLGSTSAHLGTPGPASASGEWSRKCLGSV